MKQKLVLHSKYEHLRSQLQEMLQDFFETGQYVAMGDRNVIKKVTLGDTVFNIKKFKTPNVFQGLVYRFLRKSKAKRSFEYASKLLELGINTPFPIGYSEAFSPGLSESFYICEHISYDFDFRVLNHHPKFPGRDEILKQVAAFTYNLHEKQVHFLDHSPGNTLIMDRKDGTYDFYLIDLNRMKFGPLSFDKRMRNFRRLWLSKKMIKVMAKEYARLSGTPFEKTHRLMSRYSRAFQKKINAKKLRRRKKH